MTRALCHFDNAYWLPNVAMHGYSARTNTQSNTAFRGFGGPQGATPSSMMDLVAAPPGRDPLAVRATPTSTARANGTHAPTASRSTTTRSSAWWACRLQASSGCRRAPRRGGRLQRHQPGAERPGADAGEVRHPFNVVHLNQARRVGARVHRRLGALVNHGGTEMGQGLNTGVAQVVAHELGLPLDAVRCSATDTHKVANTRPPRPARGPT